MNRPVEFAFTGVPAADHRQDLSGLRVERNERRLEFCFSFRNLAPLFEGVSIGQMVVIAVGSTVKTR